MELMLDTICNVFGGIMFLAVLVVILTQANVEKLLGPVTSEQRVALEVRQLRFELRRSANREKHLDEQLKIMRDTLDGVSTHGTGKLLEARDRFQRTVADAQRRLDGLRLKNEELQASVKHLPDDERRLDENIALRKTAAQRTKRQINLLQLKVPRQVRLPHRHARARGSARYYVIQDTKAYQLLEVRWRGLAHDSGGCRVTPGTSAGIPQAYIKPINGKGCDVPLDGTQPREFLATLKNFPAGGHYIVFFVYAEDRSHEAFQVLKKTVANKRYSYVAGFGGACEEGDGFYVVPTRFHKPE